MPSDKKEKLRRIYNKMATLDERNAIDLKFLERELKASIKKVEEKIPEVKPDPRIDDLKEKIDNLEIPQPVDLEPVNKKIDDLEEKLADSLTSIQENVIELPEVKDFTPEINKLRREVMNKIANIGGGAPNRQIFIGGNDPLTKYTDINFKAGTDIVLSYANNDTTKKVDITIAGSGAGQGFIVRSINSLSTSSVLAAAPATDYVFLCTAGIQLTLPTAVGNTNMYTIKNNSNSSVLVSTTASQTIDGNPTAILATQYTAVDIESDSQNWNIV